MGERDCERERLWARETAGERGEGKAVILGCWSGHCCVLEKEMEHHGMN